VLARRLKPHGTPFAQPFTGQKDHSLDNEASDINKEYRVDLWADRRRRLVLDALSRRSAARKAPPAAACAQLVKERSQLPRRRGSPNGQTFRF